MNPTSTTYRLVLSREMLQRKNILLKHWGRLCSLISVEFYKYDSRRRERSKSKVCAAENFTLPDA